MFSTLTTLTVLGSCAYEPQSCQFTFTAVTVLGQFEAGPTVPAGVGSWAVQTQLAWAQVSHHALIHIWTQSTDTSEYKLPSLALNKTALLAVISSINNHRMSTPLSLSWAICRRSVWHHFFLFEDQCLIVLCKDGVNGARGGGVYDPKMMWCLEKVFWAQIKGVLGVISLTPNAIHSCTFTFVSNFQERNSHTHTHTHTHLFGTTKAKSCTNTAESLTVTLLSILRHRKTRLTCDTREGTLCVCTCSPGACGGQRTLVNIWWIIMQTNETANAGKDFSQKLRTKDSRQEQESKRKYLSLTGLIKKTRGGM